MSRFTMVLGAYGGFRIGRCLLFHLLAAAVTIANVPGHPTAQATPSSSHNPPRLAQLIFRDLNNNDNNNHDPSSTVTTTAPPSAHASTINKHDMASSVSTSTLPPTELRIIYPPNSVGPQQDHVFPNRIRFSQSQIPESEPSTIMSVGSPNHLGSAPRAGSESFQEANQFIADTSADQRAAAANLIMPPFHVTRILAFSQSLINQSTASYRGENLAADNSSRNNITAASDEPGTSRQRLTSGTGVDERAAVRMLDNGLAATSSSSAGAGTGGGPITVGGLIGIIAGVLTALVLAAFLGLLCYRRRYPTWNSAETDMRVLAAHYGSYWDDKTLPNYQFNDRIVWPGETHEEMIALDNDAFLKSLEDLGRVNSRPSSKTNWNTGEEDQRQSTKV